MSLRRTLSILAATAVAAAGVMALTPGTTASATIDTSGTEFWIAFDSNYHYVYDIPSLHIYVAGAQGVEGKVEVPGQSLSYPFKVPAEGVADVTVDSSAAAVGSGSPEDRAVHVTANAPVTVYGLNHVVASTDGFRALPVTALGKSYRVLDYYGLSGNPAFLSVVPAESGPTVVTISPPGGTPSQVTLNQGQVFEFQATPGDDLTGATVTSDKLVSVFGGNVCAFVPMNVMYCNHLVEQMDPTDTWGQTYLTFPLATRTGGDTFRILADQDNTTVTIEGASTQTQTLMAGRYYEFVSAEPMRITGDKPIAVAQYSNGESFDGAVADPFMVVIPPLDQGLQTTTVSTPASDFPDNYLNIVVPTAETASVRLDGAPVAGPWTPIGQSAYSGIAVPVSVGTHTVAGPTLNQVVVYGFSFTDGYGYPAGLRAADLTAVTTLTLTPPTVTGAVGDRLCTTVTVKDGLGQPVASVNVDVELAGAETSTAVVTTNAAGQAEICRTLNAAGRITVKASHGQLSATARLIWGNQPPHLPPLVYEDDEGNTVTLDASAAVDADGDPLTFSWDLNNDGTFGDATGPTAPYLLLLVGSYQAAVQISDGIDTVTVPVTVTARNVVPAPTIDPVGQLDATARQLSTQGRFTDPGADLWTATVDYGDGTGPQPLDLLTENKLVTPTAKNFDLAHSYAAAGTYTVTVAVTDMFGRSTGTASITVVVPALAPPPAPASAAKALTDAGSSPLALFLGFIAGGLLIAGGTLMLSRENLLTHQP